MLFPSLFLVLILHTLDSQARGGEDDYWGQNYDQNQNCAQRERIAELKPKTGWDRRCFSEMITSSLHTDYDSNIKKDKDRARAFHTCKMKLAGHLDRLCDFTDVESPGKLLYCQNRGVITCCFDQHQCVRDWTEMQKHTLDVAREYLKGPKVYIKKKVKRMGYKTCHVLKNSLDASVCAKDCESMKKQKFAKDCKKNGGLFKCCIRRDAAFCHECRFCCTLGMCTYPNPGTGQVADTKTVFDEQVCEEGICKTDQEIKLSDQNNQEMASELFLSLQSIYEKWDYRCLVPNSHEDPTQWKTYDMHAFRAAFSKEGLDKVPTFKHDPNFNNFIDPKVLKQYVKNPRKTWKKSYGFPFTRTVYWDGKDTTSGDTSKCWWECANLEVSKFARTCAKNGGFFKCCVSVWNLNYFEIARNKLISEGLIKAKATKSCKPGGTKDPCVVCQTEGVCTTMDTATGMVEYIYHKKYKPEHKVGGPDQSVRNPVGLRFSFCLVGDLCQSIPQHWEWDSKEYREAMNKKEVCQIRRVSLVANETETKNFGDHCLNAHSNNIFLCPEKILKDKSNKITRFLNEKISKHACCKSKKNGVDKGKRKKVTKKEKKTKKKKKEVKVKKKLL